MKNGTIRLFQAWGIDVFLHWSWLLVAMIMIQRSVADYASPVWAVAEYVSLFGIVLMHEFGHSLACRQVGGQANRIVLWPLGGIAFVDPPPRPGALLWSIAAGPLVNVALVPVFFLLNQMVASPILTDSSRFVGALQFINLALLIFNMLPIYPLDGGQILRSLLWFFVGRAKSLTAASVIGVLGGVALIALAIWARSWFMGIVAAFMISQCVRAIKQGKVLNSLELAPRHQNYRCPNCQAHPLKGNFWNCGRCGTAFDTFESGGNCPSCGLNYDTTTCPECRRGYPMATWREG